MLKPNSTRELQAPSGRFVIVAARYNSQFVDGMVDAAKAELERSGASAVQVFRVPGSFEVPVAAARILRASKELPLAIICLGVIIRGETAHADHIGQAITNELMHLQVATGVPLVHEVLLVSNESQAAARCLSADRNRGTEAAQTAVEMARLFEEISSHE